MKKAENQPKYYEKAFDLYNKHFFKDGKPPSFEQINDETHKTIGNLLNHLKMYQDASKHFDYV